MIGGRTSQNTQLSHFVGKLMVELTIDFHFFGSVALPGQG